MSNVVRLPFVLPAPKVDLKFNEFWNLYPRPRRKNKSLCRAKWDAITNGGLETRTFDNDSGGYVTITLTATPDEIIEGLKLQLPLWRGKGEERYGWADGGKFIPLCSTWLNKGRFEDLLGCEDATYG